MGDYIDRNAFLSEQRRIYCNGCDRRKGVKNGKVRIVYDIGDAPCRACGIADILDALEDVTAADVVPAQHGRWVSMDSEKAIAMDDDGCPVDSCRCSECGDWLTGSDEYMVRGRYCPNCGARMDGDGDV